MRSSLIVVLTALLVSIFLSCSNNSSQNPSNYERANDPWVFRSVLDQRPRMVTVALNKNMWVSYSAQTGAFYKAWKGSVNFDGAVYTTAHGPQPTAVGDAYFVNQYDEPWTVINAEKKEQPNLQYRGHKFENGQVWINYDLVLNNGASIRVKERPEYITKENGQHGLERHFEIENLPNGTTLELALNLNSIAVENNILTDGAFEITQSDAVELGGLRGLDIQGILTLNSGKSTFIKAFFTKKPFIPDPNKEAAFEEEEKHPGELLIARNDCKTCHNTHTKTIGPAYMDVAKRYLYTTENITMLTAKVKNGGSGVWGEAMMNPHPEVAEEDIRNMVEYIMLLDGDEDEKGAAEAVEHESDLPRFTPTEIDPKSLLPGLVLKVFQSNRPLKKLDDVNWNARPSYEGVIGKVKVSNSAFQKLTNNFGILYEGFLKAPVTGAYVLNIRSDDGSRLKIGDKMIINHDGAHGASPMEAKVYLEEGLHPICIEYFQGGGGKSLSLSWKGPEDETFDIIPITNFEHLRSEQPGPSTVSPPFANSKRIPGDGSSLDDVHPSYDLSQARPDDFLPKVAGMDFLPDGRLVVSTWDAEGSVYILDGVTEGEPSKINVKKIASGLAEPLGLKVVQGEIFVLQKQELTQLIDHDEDEIIDEYYTLANSWTVSANFHEFAFGLAYKDGYFYATLAIAILPGGASAPNQMPDRGKVVKISKQTGEMTFAAHGLRTPNGIGIGLQGEIFVADNQGDWLPSSKILHIQEGHFYGSRAVDFEGTEDLEVTLPVVWLPQNEIGNSPSTPILLKNGPYTGQMIHGEVTHGGIKRVFVEKVNDAYQGCVFRFIQGLEAGVNRMVWGPDESLYVGGVGSRGNWSHTGKQWYGLQRLTYNSQPTFEMLAVRAKSNGIEIEFTEPVGERFGNAKSAYLVEQWRYVPTSNYGGPKVDKKTLNISSINFLNNRKKVFLEIPGIKEGHVVYVKLPSHWNSINGNEIWATEAWYTMNAIPKNEPGSKSPSPTVIATNTLTKAEIAAGWKLLFDGKTTDGWRNFKSDKIGSSWKVIDGALVLDAKQNAEGRWEVADGGDIISEDQYDNFELSLEWKIAPCGNSGIMFNVVEGEEYKKIHHTGPEVQILDNTCHPDSRYITHRAGDLYDLIECKYEAANPAGEWNWVRIIMNNGKLEQWLNGRKLVETTLWTPEWDQLVAGSKFKKMPGFGKYKKGHIALQDHRDRVSFRNIKIRALKEEI